MACSKYINNLSLGCHSSFLLCFSSNDKFVNRREKKKRQQQETWLRWCVCMVKHTLARFTVVVVAVVCFSFIHTRPTKHLTDGFFVVASPCMIKFNMYTVWIEWIFRIDNVSIGMEIGRDSKPSFSPSKCHYRDVKRFRIIIFVYFTIHYCMSAAAAARLGKTKSTIRTTGRINWKRRICKRIPNQ